ncbi:MAG: hypothetical protein ACXACC_08155 [Promethearchaeota archaeon]|jgi:hypothetical protein
MRKRSISFILFAVAGLNLILALLSQTILDPLFRMTEVPPNQAEITKFILFVSNIITAIALTCAGVIILIKFRKK